MLGAMRAQIVQSSSSSLKSQTMFANYVANARFASAGTPAIDVHSGPASGGSDFSGFDMGCSAGLNVSIVAGLQSDMLAN